MKLFLSFLLIFLSDNAFGQSSGRFSITRAVLASGGTTFSTSSRFQLGSTIGQSATSVPSSGRFSIQSGFWYRPALEIVAVAKVGTNFVFSFETEAGKAYSVEYADSIASPSWQNVANFTGDGVAKTVTQSAVGVTNRFYRVIQQ